MKRKTLLEILEVAKKLPSKLVESPREKGRGVGGYSIKLCSERLRPEVQSLTLIYTIFNKRYPFRISSIELKVVPFSYICFVSINR